MAKSEKPTRPFPSPSLKVNSVNLKTMCTLKLAFVCWDLFEDIGLLYYKDSFNGS